ncbi:hypothetical protein HQN90_00600 [Paenibacillus alba]|uniref:phage/plasmid replication domain-containing protein n=1 Tax=Paenibacillus alba TaxID=1197127 RepID=UPI001566F7CC|nr:phage/plasmid replication protein [Paenibacillus alba]NQX64614.1 hypothetical protein [Paenibacillus alba]
MFDTITLKTNIKIDHDLLLEYDKQPITYFDHDTGFHKPIYKIHDKYIPYIVYRELIQLLEIQISIPKFLFGNNVRLLKESDIPLFFQRLHQRLHELFNIHVRTENWYLSRIDVCWSFQVNDQVSEYIKQISRIQIPFMKAHTDGYLETVTHNNKSSRVTFYNKQKECIDHKEPREVIEQAQGLLRMEVSPSYKDMKKYSSKRLAIDLLTRDFFTYTTKRIIRHIKLPDSVEGLTIGWLQTHSHIIGQVERTLYWLYYRLQVNRI